MRASIKSFHIQDQLGETYWPEDPHYFGALVDMTIGPAESEAGDIFSCFVCSPSWFAENVLKTARQHPSHEDVEHPPTFGRHYLFALSFDENDISSAIEQWVESHEADGWAELSQRLSRNLAWEYEDNKAYG